MTVKATLELPKLARKHEQPAVGYQAFRWPEFLAFADRLGVDLTAPIKRLVIDMEEDRVSILIDQQGSDTAGMLDEDR